MDGDAVAGPDTFLIARHLYQESVGSFNQALLLSIRPDDDHRGREGAALEHFRVPSSFRYGA